MRFTKAHGSGNDFIVIDDRAGGLELGDALVRALCDRRTGVGADGVIRVSQGAAGSVVMDHRNADGSRPQMCGNGVRVTAKYAVDHELVRPGPDGSVVVSTLAGERSVRVERDERGLVVAATVDMGLPSLRPSDVPVDSDRDRLVDEPFDVDGASLRLTVLSMGNPHAVTFVDDVARTDVARVGERLEHDPRFPEGINVEFAQIVSRDELALRVWERGVGETAACGTGASAAVVAARETGRVADEVDVHLPGGVLTVRYAPTSHPSVFLTGPAVEVATGELDEAWLARLTAAAGRR